MFFFYLLYSTEILADQFDRIIGRLDAIATDQPPLKAMTTIGHIVSHPHAKYEPSNFRDFKDDMTDLDLVTTSNLPLNLVDRIDMIIARLQGIISILNSFIHGHQYERLGSYSPVSPFVEIAKQPSCREKDVLLEAWRNPNFDYMSLQKPEESLSALNGFVLGNHSQIVKRFLPQHPFLQDNDWKRSPLKDLLDLPQSQPSRTQPHYYSCSQKIPLSTTLKYASLRNSPEMVEQVGLSIMSMKTYVDKACNYTMPSSSLQYETWLSAINKSKSHFFTSINNLLRNLIHTSRNYNHLVFQKLITLALDTAQLPSLFKSLEETCEYVIESDNTEALEELLRDHRMAEFLCHTALFHASQKGSTKFIKLLLTSPTYRSYLVEYLPGLHSTSVAQKRSQEKWDEALLATVKNGHFPAFCILSGELSIRQPSKDCVGKMLKSACQTNRPQFVPQILKWKPSTEDIDLAFADACKRRRHKIVEMISEHRRPIDILTTASETGNETTVDSILDYARLRSLRIESIEALKKAIQHRHFSIALKLLRNPHAIISFQSLGDALWHFAHQNILQSAVRCLIIRSGEQPLWQNQNWKALQLSLINSSSYGQFHNRMIFQRLIDLLDPNDPRKQKQLGHALCRLIPYCPSRITDRDFFKTLLRQDPDPSDLVIVLARLVSCSYRNPKLTNKRQACLTHTRLVRTLLLEGTSLEETSCGSMLDQKTAPCLWAEDSFG